MKKYLTLILILGLTIFNTITVSAEEKNIIVETKRDNNYLYLTYTVKANEIKGIATELEYNDENATLESCTSKTGFEISTNKKDNLVIIAENLENKKNLEIMTCIFKIKNSKSSIKLKTIDASTNSLLKEDIEEVDFKLGETVHVEDTAKNGNNTINYIFSFIFLIAGIYLIYRTIKMKDPVYLLLLLLLPINVKAEEIIYTKNDLDKVRNIILKKIEYNEEIDTKLDYDKDNKITINDLILIKHDANIPKIEITTQTEGTAEYHTKVTSEVKVDTITNISEIKYCYGTDNCTPDTILDETNKTFTIKHKDDEQALKICLKVTNKIGLSKTKCTSKYLVDSKTPTLSFKKQTITITNNVTHNPQTNIVENNETQSITCSTPPTTVGTHTISCIITGRNGLTSEQTYSLIINKKNYKILFVGNSKTYKNDIPGKLKGLIEASNFDATITSITEGGKTLDYLAENYESDLKAINGYEYVIMQEQTDTYASNYNKFLSGARAILNILKTKNSSIKPIIRQTWVLAEEIDGNFYFKNDEDVTSGYNNAKNVANNINAILIPEGRAYQSSTSAHRDILLFYDDRHQTVEGAYLSAATIYKHIFNKSPVGNTYKADLSQDVATKLQIIANQTT